MSYVGTGIALVLSMTQMIVLAVVIVNMLVALLVIGYAVFFND